LDTEAAEGLCGGIVFSPEKGTESWKGPQRVRQGSREQTRIFLLGPSAWAEGKAWPMTAQRSDG
jgi:hypothetical protein